MIYKCKVRVARFHASSSFSVMPDALKKIARNSSTACLLGIGNIARLADRPPSYAKRSVHATPNDISHQPFIIVL